MDILSPALTLRPLHNNPYTQSFSPVTIFGSSSLNPKAVSLAVASRTLLLSIISGIATVGDEGEFTVTYIVCPIFTLVPSPGLWAKMQSAGILLLYPESLTMMRNPLRSSKLAALLKVIPVMLGTGTPSPWWV